MEALDALHEFSINFSVSLFFLAFFCVANCFRVFHDAIPDIESMVY
jgi:hypothetical protein